MLCIFTDQMKQPLVSDDDEDEFEHDDDYEAKNKKVLKIISLFVCLSVYMSDPVQNIWVGQRLQKWSNLEVW